MSSEPTRTLLVLPPPPSAIGAWTLLWGAVLDWRRRRVAAQARRLPAPVISIGNLQLGGSGKTPLVAAIAAHLRERGRRVLAGPAELLGELEAGERQVAVGRVLRGREVALELGRRALHDVGDELRDPGLELIHAGPP